MKTQKAVLVMMTLALSLLSLCIISPLATSHAALIQTKKFKLEVLVKDPDGKPVANARVTAWYPPLDNPSSEANTDADGVATLQVERSNSPNIDLPGASPLITLAIMVVKPDFHEERDYVHFAGKIPDEVTRTIFLKRTGAQRVNLAVTVKDSKGDAVGNAKVNVWHNRPGPLSGTPDYQGDTNADGVAAITVETTKNAFNGNKQELLLIIRVVKTDFEASQDQVQYLNNVPDEVTRTITIRKHDITLGDMTLQLHVVDANDEAVAGADVQVWARTWPLQHSSGKTDSDGNAAISVTKREAFSVVVTKDGLPETSHPVRIEGNPLPAAAGPFTIKMGKATGRILSFTVKDAKDNSAVSDAHIVLKGRAYLVYVGNTDEAGKATIVVPEKGAYQVTVRQSTYERVIGDLIEVTDEEKQEFNYTLDPIKKQDNDAIEVTVVAKDPDDPIAAPKPLKDALVRAGSKHVLERTDAGGRAVVAGNFDLTEDVYVEADGYKSQAKSVEVRRAQRNGKGIGRASFVLEMDTSETRPLHFVVAVLDAASNGPVNDANVLVRLNGKIIAEENTDPKGEAHFTLKDSNETPLAKVSQGLRLDVGKDVGKERYKLKYSDVIAASLKPSLNPGVFTVFLERDWDDIRRAVEALEPRVFAWNNDMRADNSGPTKAFIDKALIARQEAQALANEINAGVDGIVVASGGKSMCGLAAPYLLDIRSAEAKANQKAAQIETSLKSATAAAGACSSPAQAESLRATYRKAIQTLAEIGILNKQAAKDHEELTAIAQKNLAAKDLIAQLRQKLANIERLENVATENAAGAAAVFGRTADRSKTLISRQLTLKSELAVLLVKVEAETGVPNDLLKRISTMEQILGSTNNIYSYGTQPEQALPQSVRDAAATIGDISRTAEAKILQVDGWPCNVATLDDLVNGVNTTFTNAQFEIGLAADLPKQADECVANATRRTNTNSGVNTSTESDPAASKPDDKTSTSTGSTKDKKPAAAEDDPEIKIVQPIKPNSQDTSPGGFWDAAKAGKKDVENKITTKPAKPTNTTGAGENSENKSSTNTAATKTGTKTTKPLTGTEAEENGTSKRPSANPSTDVEDIPETAVKPAAARGSVETEQASSSQKKPKDPNKPSKWTKAGQILGAIAAATNNQNQGTNYPGTTSTGTTNTGTNTGTTGSTSGGSGKEWMLRNAYHVDLIQIAVRGGQVIWTDRATRDISARQGCVRDPALFSGSFDGKIFALDWTFNAEFCPSVGKYYSTSVREACTLQLNSDNSLSGTCTSYTSEFSSDRRTLVPQPPTTDKADGICVKCQ